MGTRKRSLKNIFLDEIDTRFSLCALATLHFLDRLDEVNVEKAIDYVLSCYNFDGGFGTRPGSESHAGQVCTKKKILNSKMRKIEIKFYLKIEL